MSAPLVERLRKELAHHIAYSDTSEGELAAEAADTIEALLSAAVVALDFIENRQGNDAAETVAKSDLRAAIAKARAS